MNGASPPLLADPLAELLRQLDAAPHTRRVVGIVGVPGAGKSTLAGRLAEAVNTLRGGTALQRLALRHQQAWGIAPEAVARRIEDNDRPNALIVMQTLPRADARVSLDAACTS